MQELLYFLCAILFSFPTQAMEIVCPKTIPIYEKIVKAPDGWKGGEHERDHRFEDVDFGIISLKHKPGDMDAHMREDEEIIKDNIATLTWYVDGSNAKYLQGGYAIFCSYQNTDIQITKPLPRTLKKCIAHYKVEHGKYLFIDANCY